MEAVVNTKCYIANSVKRVLVQYDPQPRYVAQKQRTTPVSLDLKYRASRKEGFGKHRPQEAELCNNLRGNEPEPGGIWKTIRPEGDLPRRFETDIVRQRESVRSKLRGAFSSSSKTTNQDIDHVDRMYRDTGNIWRSSSPDLRCHPRARTDVEQQRTVYVRGSTDESWTELRVGPSMTLRHLLDTWSRSPEHWMHCSGSDGNMNYEKLSDEVLSRSVGEHLRAYGGRYFMVHDSAWKSNWSPFTCGGC
ncbi:hypothetical protein AC578_6976 [Pseudocercospora eumusae]|uniref:Uncharacterized protein n=1 Tax=Pseudocercospora eumusae TaxID=321146 RepID=A0A139H9G4_9PEZI|nr:hypothetical protein AC578_6976 [Pseudocercospora eumusae]